MEDTLVKQSQVFKLKASSYNITTLSLLDNNIKLLAKQLLKKINLAPNFFKHAPVVIDLTQLFNSNKFIDFNELKHALSNVGLLPIGVKNANLHHSVHAKNAGFAILAQGQTSYGSDFDHERASKNQIVNTPIRSGQQLINEYGDLTICAHVGNGAEVVAMGSIHVYGSLKGKAIAGMRGDPTCRIFCQSLEAELISIAGLYIPSEDIEKIIWKKPAMVYLENDRLHVEHM